MLGIDVSSHQHPIQWDLAAPHVGYVISKASQGIAYPGPATPDWYAYNRDACRRRGVPHGSYHWLEPAEAHGVPQEIIQQVQWFKRRVGDLQPGDIIPTFDIEETLPGQGRRAGIPSPNDIALALDVAEQEFQLPRERMLSYGGQAVLLPAAFRRPEIARTKLWKAFYPGINNGDPAAKARGYGTIAPWSTITMWQWTSRGKHFVPGIPSAGLDVNELLVPLIEILVALVAPPPRPPEEEESMFVRCPWEPARPGGTKGYVLRGNQLLTTHGAPLLVEFAPDSEWIPPGMKMFDLTTVATGHLWSGLDVAVADDLTYRVVTCRDDGATYEWPTGVDSRQFPILGAPVPTAPSTPQLPTPQEIARAVAPHLRVSAV